MGRALRAVALAVGLALGAALGAAHGAAHGAALDLEGSWYVLIHYRDHGGAEPDLAQWDERVFEFAREGDTLRFTEHPVVVFDDDRGRLGRGDGQLRALGYWEPDADQLREIEAGLRTTSRGRRDLVLRRTLTGWSSAAGPPRYDSARFVTWSSDLAIELGGEHPRLVFSDALGSQAADAIRGRTIFEILTVAASGDLLEGRYDRDGTRQGRFSMRRSGPRGSFEAGRAAEPTKAEVYERFYRELGRQLRSDRGLPERAPADVDRAAFAARVRERVEALYRAQGNDPQPHLPQVLSLSEKVTARYVDEGATRDEIGVLIVEGALRP